MTAGGSFGCSVFCLDERRVVRVGQGVDSALGRFARRDRGVELVLGFVEPCLRLVAPDRRCPQSGLHRGDDFERALGLLLARVDELALLRRDVVGGSAASA